MRWLRDSIMKDDSSCGKRMGIQSKVSRKARSQGTKGEAARYIAALLCVVVNASFPEKMKQYDGGGKGDLVLLDCLIANLLRVS